MKKDLEETNRNYYHLSENALTINKWIVFGNDIKERYRCVEEPGNFSILFSNL